MVCVGCCAGGVCMWVGWVTKEKMIVFGVVLFYASGVYKCVSLQFE
jgi:hypothetical protein